MNVLPYYDNLVFEEKIIATSLQITVIRKEEGVDSARVVFDKAIPIPLAIVLVIIMMPFLALLLALVLLYWPFSLLNKPTADLSYEETKAYFNSGKGYLNNLSERDKKALMVKRENAPLGL